MSVLENLIKTVPDHDIVTIGNLCIESINVAPNVSGVRVANIISNFKRIFHISLVGFISEGQSDPDTMRQMIHSGYEYSVNTKQIRLYSSGSQSIEATVFGLI